MNERQERAALQAYAEAAGAYEDAAAAARLAQYRLDAAHDNANDTDHIRYPVVATLADGRQVTIDAVHEEGNPHLEYTIGQPL